MDFFLVSLFMLAALLTAVIIALPLEEGGDTNSKGGE